MRGKIYFVYKFDKTNLENLRKKLEAFDTICKRLGWDTFIFFRDVENWQITKNMTKKEIFDRAYEEFKKCDLVIVDASQGSDGVFYELGWAKPLNKRVIGIYQEGIDRFIKEVMIDKTIQYASYEDLEDKLKAAFKK